MGITGLIPFMEKASTQTNISQFKGGCAAIDAYCWLHKGTYSCAEKLARGEPTEAYVYYCMKLVNMLLSHNVKPILVFDGQNLPAKAGTEKQRRGRRDISRKQAAEMLRTGHTEAARNLLRRSVDVTHEMALKLIQECRRRNVDCIVAPYEADAELGYLSIKNIAQVIITEDSDLILFGCTKILFKMDINGYGTLVERERLHLAMGCRVENFDFDKFRYMCILSGCDYLPSLPGIGLAKACKFVTRTSDPDIHKALARMPVFLNMLHLPMTPEYRDEFLRADATFRYQLVFDPLTRSQTTLTETPPNYKPADFTGKRLQEDIAYQLALGNLDPFTLNVMDHFDPDGPRPVRDGKTTGWKQSPRAPHPSIWKAGYKPRPIARTTDPRLVDRPTTKGKVVNLRSPLKKIEAPDTSLTNTELASIYGTSPPSKKLRLGVQPEEIMDALFETTPEKKQAEEEPVLSPIIGRDSARRNPFAKGEKKKKKEPVVEKALSPVKYTCKFSALEKFTRRRDSSGDVSTVQSRYFASEETASSKSVTLEPLSNDGLKDEQPSPETRSSSSPIKQPRKYITKDGRTVISPAKEFFKTFDPDTEKVNIISLSKSHEESESFINIITDETIPEVSDTAVLNDITECSKTLSSKKNLLSSFKWGSLHDKFSYAGPKKIVLESTESASKSFKPPSVMNVMSEISFERRSLLDEEEMDDPSPEGNCIGDGDCESETTTTTKISISNSNKNVSANMVSDEGFCSLTPPSRITSQLSNKPCRPLVVGLRKSKTSIIKKTDPKQQTLLNMFGFKGNSSAKKIIRQ